MRMKINKGRLAKRMAFYSHIRRKARSVGKVIKFLDRSGRPVDIVCYSQKDQWSTAVMVPTAGSILRS